MPSGSAAPAHDENGSTAARAGGRGEAAPPGDALVVLVQVALNWLEHLRTPDAGVVDLERRLRAAVERPGTQNRPGAVAVRTACAYLACGDVSEAYFALLTARDLMATPPQA